jgi:hypothetical protein
MTALPLTAVIIPWRDRGTDPLRPANLARVLEHWETFEHTPWVVGDGRQDKELFNRSAAYNRGIAAADPDTEVFIFAESDMLCPPDQIFEAVTAADKELGMVVPFSTYHYHSREASQHILQGTDPARCKPMWRMVGCRSIGAINVMSRKTLDALGQWDEKFEGNWYDDDAMKLALDLLAGPTRFIEGTAHHLYHLPGHRGKHLTDMEKMATKRNQKRLALYDTAAETKNAAMMRRLLKGEI